MKKNKTQKLCFFFKKVKKSQKKIKSCETNLTNEKNLLCCLLCEGVCQGFAIFPAGAPLLLSSSNGTIKPSARNLLGRGTSFSCFFAVAKRKKRKLKEMLDFFCSGVYLVRRWRPTRKGTMYYFVRSCVRWLFWTVIISAFWLALINYTNNYTEKIPDCELGYFPCETPTTIYDPYGMGG